MRSSRTTPAILPAPDGASFGVAARATGPTGDVTGDFSDVVELADGRWLLVVGDIEGKGEAAAPAAVRSQRLLHDVGIGGSWPHQLVARLNRAPRRWGPNDADRSLAVCVLSIRACPGGFAGRVCNAGSPLPFVVGDDGTLRSLGGPGQAVGYFPDTTWNDWAFRLVPGDTLIAFTDGLTDARSRNRLFGEGRLDAAARALAARHPGDGPRIAQELIAEACRFVGPSEPQDDIVVVVLAVAAFSPAGNGRSREDVAAVEPPPGGAEEDGDVGPLQPDAPCQVVHPGGSGQEADPGTRLVDG